MRLADLSPEERAALTAEIIAAQGGPARGHLRSRAPGWLAGRERIVFAIALLGCLVGAALAIVPSFSALGAWLSLHAEWSVQVAFLAIAAAIINAGYLVLQFTILDPLLIGPEFIGVWLDWRKRYLRGERSDEDGAFMRAGATYAGAVLVMMGIITFGTFYVGVNLG